MNNLFSELEEKITFREDICFDEKKIQEFILEEIKRKLEASKNKGFAFEEIVYNFLNI